MISDILFLKADGSYCQLKSKECTITFSENLRFLERKLDFAKEFVRIHRSYIVNVNSIQRVHENRLWIADTEIPIGKTYKNMMGNIVRFI
jgi:DNA-binding LytR/AlgR family response regulator